MHKSVYLSESGRINFVTILLILVVAAGVYLGIMLAPPYIEHSKLEAKIRAVGNMAHREKDYDVLMKNLKKELEVLELNLPDEAIDIEQDPRGRWVRFSIEYARVVDFVPFGVDTTLHFYTEHIEELRASD
jgi:hypothetical protein